jgi:ankyrin repeat protein
MAPSSLPERPDLEWLRKEAKRRLDAMPGAQLADAQLALAREYGYASWRALKAHIDGLTIDGQFVEAARAGDAARLEGLLDEFPERLHQRFPPYQMTLLHLAANSLPCIELLLQRGLDPNAKEDGDRTYAMHWAAAAGNLDVVRRLADAGGDVIGHGDDHELEVIGWATCWEGADDAAHRAVAEFLVSRGARHHIFSAIAVNDAEEVRRIVAREPGALSRRMSRNENHRLPLHFAVRANRPAMVSLLLELGADPLGADDGGMPAAAYAGSAGVDRPVMEAIRELTRAELDSARRGHRPPRLAAMDLYASLALHDWPLAERIVTENPALVAPAAGVLHLMAKRGDVDAAAWLLDHGADPSARWPHWDAEVTPLHLASLEHHPGIATLLLDRGADPRIKDTKHDGDAMDWARFFNRADIVALLEARGY